MATQGIELPVSLLIKNLQDIANLIKLFASKNILSNSLGGKKIDQELGKVLTRLDQIAAKAKTALTTQSDFSSILKDIDQVELGLNRIANATKNLTFADLRIPDDVSGLITALLTRIKELQNSLITFKGTLKEKLINNLDFLANLNVAEPTKAAKLLLKGYDELYKAIETGMNNVIQTIDLKNAEYNTKISLLNNMGEGRNAFTQWGALDYLSLAFKSINKNGSKNDVQLALSDALNFDEKGFTGFKGGFNGMNTFLSRLAEQFNFSDIELAEIRGRIRELAKELNKSWTDVIKNMGTDSGLAKKILFGDNTGLIEALRESYASLKAEVDKLKADIDKDTTRADAYKNLSAAFDLPNQEIAAKAKEIADALLEPQQRLTEFELTLLATVANSPALAQLFGLAAQEISSLNNVVEAGKNHLASLDAAIGKMQGISNFVNRYIGLYAIVRKVITAIRNAFNNIQELDKNITNIAVVTNMSQADLWGKIGEYTQMAQQYGVATKDVYTVSQLFYQQGLQTNQVMALTTETLKMAKISGMEYGDAANAMTVAIRAFKIEMTEAQLVTDVYSALAAKFAVSSSEIANAMEKTASSAANVGMSLESTSAFISVMTQTTRESAQNIGSALKSIISRYGEMKASPTTLLNVDGEEVAFNKVDTALKSIGISIKDSAGQFRDFDDVIMELAKKWDSLDNNTQRYVATVMAGNRQQSRFIALVSNYDELNRAMNVASTAENASIVLTAKTMDSLESKANQLKNAFSQLYLDLHIEEGLKNAYDWLTRIVTTIGKLGTLNGVIPTLMNAIGLGTGTKSLLNMGKDWLTDRKAKYTVETADAELRIKNLQTLMQETVLKVVEVKADTTLYDLAMTVITGTKPVVTAPVPAQATANAVVAATTPTGTFDNTMGSMLGILTQSSGKNAADVLGLLMGGYGSLEKPEGVKSLLSELNLDEKDTNYSAISEFLTQLGTTSSGFDALNAALQEAVSGTTQFDGTLQGLVGILSSTSGQSSSNILGNIMSQYGDLSGEAGKEARKQLLGEYGINTDNKNFGALDQFLDKLASAPGGIDELINALSELSGAAKEATGSTLAESDAKKTNTTTTEGESQAKKEETDATQLETLAKTNATSNEEGTNVSKVEEAKSALEVANANVEAKLKAYDLALAEQKAALDAVTAGDTSKEAALFAADKKLTEADAALKAAEADLREAESSYKAAAADEEEANSGGKKGGAGIDDEGGKKSYNSTLMKGIGVATGLARIIGTAITAAGAAHQDKSTDKYETSKILTGVGNGLSMAGTGASMGLAFGPWGALVGAIGGFLVGGLGAIIDGAQMTIKERVELLKKEAQEAVDANLKTLAKAMDLSALLDNLKKLRKTMYSSTEDMQEYKDAMNTMANQYPELISSYDEAGNAIIDLNSAEAQLTELRLAGALAARLAAIALGTLYTGYKEALLGAYKAAQKTSAGHSELTLYGTDAATLDSQYMFAILMSDGSTRLFGKSTYYLDDRSPGSSVDYRWAESIAIAANNLLDKQFTSPDDVAQLSYEELEQVVDALIANPELGKYATAYDPFGNALYKSIPTNQWEWYKGKYFGELPVTEYTYKDLTALDTEIANYSELFGGAKTARELIGITDQTVELTEELMALIRRRVDLVIAQTDNTLNSVRANSIYSINAALLSSTALTAPTLATKDVTALQTKGIYSTLFNSMMGNYTKKNTQYGDVLEWYNANQSEFEAQADVLATQFIEWYSSLLTTLKQLLETLDFTLYTSPDEILSKLGVTKENNQAVYDAVIESFSKANETNRNRILDLIYDTDAEGNRTTNINRNMTGLQKLADYKIGDTDVNYLDDIAYHFKEGNSAPIISAYADYFATELNEINTLAELGYMEMARNRTQVLQSLAYSIGLIKDSKILSELLGTITNMDLNSFSSIKATRKAIMTYAESNNLVGTDEINNLLYTLSRAEQLLVFNVNTLASDLTTSIKTASKNIDSLLSSNKSGFSLDSALEELDKINAKLPKMVSFDEIYTYDAVLGKYILNANGLRKALQAETETLEETATELKSKTTLWENNKVSDIAKQLGNSVFNQLKSFQTAGATIGVSGGKRYLMKQEGLTSYTKEEMKAELDKLGITGYEDELDEFYENLYNDFKSTTSTIEGFKYFLQHYKRRSYNAEDIETNSEAILADVKTLYESLGLDFTAEIAEEYGTWAVGFLNAEKYTEKTWDNFWLYVLELAENGKIAAERAEQIYTAHQANIKNQYYAQIDWTKLALGTDTTGVNQQYVDLLAEELNMVGESWDKVLDAYLIQLYTDTNGILDVAQYNLAKSSLNGTIKQSRVNQITSAINEVISGQGTILSSESRALIDAFNESADSIDNRLIIGTNNELTGAGTSFIDSAIKLYETYSKELTTTAEKNNLYISIINKTFDDANNAISALSSGAAMDFSTLNTLFDSLGVEIATYYDASAKEWKDSLKGALETNVLGKTVIRNWDAFLQVIGESTTIDMAAFKKSFEYKNAYASYVDGLITLDTQEQEAIKKAYDSAFSSITGWKPINMAWLLNNQTLFDALSANDAIDVEAWTTEGQLVVKNVVAYAENISGLLTELSSLSAEDLYKETGWSRADLAKNWKNAQMVLTEVQDAWTGISENISNLSNENISTLVEKGGLNLRNLLGDNAVFKKIGDNYVLGLSAYREMLIHYVGGEGATFENLTEDQKAKVSTAYNKAAQAIVNKITGLDWTKVLDGTATSADMDTFKQSLSEALQSLGTDIAEFYSDAGEFDYRGLIADLQAQMDNQALSREIGEQIINNILTTVAAVRDTAFNEINNAMSLFTAGTTSQADMTKFLQRYNKLTKQSSSLDEVFQYDDLLHGYTLTTEALKKYYEEQRSVLKGLGMTDEAISAYINDQVQQTISAEMGISEFLSGTDISASGKNALTLIRQIQKWYSLQDVDVQKLVAQDIAKKYDISGVTTENVADYVSDYFITTLQAGGDEAVKVLKQLKGENNVTSDEIQAVYRAAMNRLNTAIEEIDNGLYEGAIITSNTADVLMKYGYSSSLTALGDGTYVVNSVISMVDAYLAIYDLMKKAAGNTTAELNSAYAKVLTANELSDIDAISALGDAMGMNYDTLGLLLATYGKDIGTELWSSLEYVMQDAATMAAIGIKQIGNGKVLITDFTKFSSKMGWEVGSEEYVKALETYNDSLITSLTETTDKVVTEIKGLTTAKTGLKINFTRIQAALNLSDAAFNTLFDKYGATIENGILTITDASKIPQLTAAITALVESAASLIPDQIAQIKDAVVDALKAIANLIKSGITGSLTNTDANTLSSWAKEAAAASDWAKKFNFSGQLDFRQTAEGLKLSEQSAIALYNTLKEVDEIRAQLVFDELSSSLQSTNEHYMTVSANMDRIAEINKELANPEVSDARRKELEAELGVAKEILAVRSTSEDSSFDFMSNKIPGAQNNPIKYAESWGKAWATIRDSFKSSVKQADRGKIEYLDFYNILTEMGHIAEVSGQPIKLGADMFVKDAESASKLIEKGAGCLSVATDGSVKVDLSKFGLDFSGGASDMQKNVDEGIKAIAQAQIDMLDSMIKMLEVIVAMEKLGDIDVNGDNHLNLGEIFLLNTDGMPKIDELTGLTLFTEEYSKVANSIIEMAKENPELEEALNSVRVNNHTMKEIFEDAIDGVNDLQIDAQQYQQVIDAFYQMAISGDYDLDNIAESIQEIMQSTGLKNITVDVGEKTFYMTGDNKFVFDWSNEEAVKAAEKALKSWSEEDLKKFNLSENSTIKDKLLELANQLEDPNLSIEDRALIEYVLQLATGVIKIEAVEGQENTYTGTYKGKKITGTYEEVEKAIQEAIRYEEEGFSFEFNDDGSVSGKLTIGGATIDINLDDNGKATYSTPWGPAGSKDEAIQKCVEHGYVDSSMNGYTYNGGNIEVQYNSSLKVGYTINHADGTYLYKGKTFKDKNTLLDYIEHVSDLVAGSEWKTSKLGTKFEIMTSGLALIKRNLETGEIEYHYNGIIFKSGKEFAEFMSAKALAEELNGEPIDVSGTGGTIEYKLYGKEIKLTVDAHGNMEYQCTIGDFTYTAGTEEGIKQAMADHDYLQGGDAGVANDTPVSYTVTHNGTSLTVTYTADSVTVSDGEGSADMQEKLDAAYQQKLSSVTPSAEVSGLEVTLASGAKVTLKTDDSADGSLKLTDTLGTVDADASELKVNPANITADLEQAKSLGQQIAQAIQEGLNGTLLMANVGTNSEGAPTSNPFEAIVTSLSEITATPFEQIREVLNSITTEKVEAIKTAQEAIGADNITSVKQAANAIDPASAISAKSAINAISSAPAEAAKAAINSIKASISPVSASGSLSVKVSVSKSSAKGNLGALAKGNAALAGGTKTLMGELGPELVVSHGRYFLAGQGGAEFVDLDKDAIVFNHQQTERLMAQGGIGSRGVPFTNESNAISYAKGNVPEGPAKADGDFNWSIGSYNWGNGTKTQDFKVATLSIGPTAAKGMGPAMASASAALAALKQLKAQWQALLNMSVKDLAGAGGGGGGGGNKKQEYGNFIRELEKWYDWLQKIAEKEEEINYQEKLRSKILSDMLAHGQDMTDSYLTSLKSLQSEIGYQKDLMDAQLKYFTSRQEWMNSTENPFSKLYTFDDQGQLLYTKDENGVSALETFQQMVGVDEYGKANMTAKEQYEKIVAMDPSLADFMKYDSEGKLIEHYKKKDDGSYELDAEGNKIEDVTWYETAVQAFWDKIDADKEEMQSLHDSINEHRDAVLEKQQAMNEIMKAIEDNQISVENRVLKALEDSRQRAIDDAKDQRDAIEQASSDLIDGLSDQLQKERDMYSDQQSADELAKIQRQLAIAQRSGASASQIASLQSQISDKMQDAYFDAQQEQIDALQEAADTQLEKLDEQIDLMEEQLEYEKEHGMLWGQVYEVMSGTPESIAQYIKDNDSSLWGESPVKSTQTMREILFESQLFTEFREKVEGGLEKLVEDLTDTSGDSDAASGDSSSDDSSSGGESGGEQMSGEQPSGVGEESAGEAAAEEPVSHNYAVKALVTSADGETHTIGSFSKKTYTVTATSEDEARSLGKDVINQKIKELNEDKYKDNNLSKAKKADIQLKEYKRGGLIDETGIIKVHGSKTRPESILNADSTVVLQSLENQLDLDKDTMTRLADVLEKLADRLEKIFAADTSIEEAAADVAEETVEEMTEATDELAKYGADYMHDNPEMYEGAVEAFWDKMQQDKAEMEALHTSIQAHQASIFKYQDQLAGRQDGSIVIEHAEVNMRVDRIADDYDAERAGEKALEKMLKIARKSSGWNRIGR